MNPKDSSDERTAGILTLAHNILAARSQSDRVQLLDASSQWDERADCLSQVAAFLAERGRQDVAIEILQFTIRLDPQLYTAHEALVQLLLLTGRSDEAATELEQLTDCDPRSDTLLALLGIVYTNMQKWEQASDALNASLRVEPNEPSVIRAAANASWKAHRRQEAIELMGRLVALEPGNPGSLFDLGVMCVDCGQFDQALHAFREALRLEPAMGLAHHQLAMVLRRLGRCHEAILHAEMACESLDPAHEMIANRGLVLIGLQRYAEAAAVLSAVDVLRSLELCLAYADALRRTRRHEEAAMVLERAIGENSSDPKPWLMLGRVKREEGSLQTANQAFERALELDPASGEAHRCKANLRHYLTKTDPHLVRMEHLAASARPWTQDSIELEFALGKAYDDLKEFGQAMRHFNRANSAKRKTVRYDEASLVQELELIRSMFPEPILGTAESARGRIFIVGMPRSGTTLLEQILACHTDVTPLGELTEFPSALFDAVFKAQCPLGLAPRPEDLERVGQIYESKIAAESNGRPRTTDKLPSNFCYLGFIVGALPGAQIVHIRRNPVDTCISLYSKLFHGPQEFSYDLGELGRFYRYYEGIMDHWRDVVPPGRLLEVEYESLVMNTESEVRRLLSFLDLAWEEACLSPHVARRPVATASSAQVRRPIYATSIGRREGYLPYIEPLLEALNCDPRKT